MAQHGAHAAAAFHSAAGAQKVGGQGVHNVLDQASWQSPDSHFVLVIFSYGRHQTLQVFGFHANKAVEVDVSAILAACPEVAKKEAPAGEAAIAIQEFDAAWTADNKLQVTYSDMGGSKGDGSVDLVFDPLTTKAKEKKKPGTAKRPAGK